jgi:DNA-binding transcriptional LysR family regulator
LELRQLAHFLAVAEAGHFTRAAARVHLTQSSLSSSVRALERELGSDLFVRSTRRVELTEAGRALLPAARRTVAAAEDGRDAVAGVRGLVRGSWRSAPSRPWVRSTSQHSSPAITAGIRPWPSACITPA